MGGDVLAVHLPPGEGPDRWYNVAAALPEPLPPPRDLEPGEPRLKMLPEVLLKECLRQENSDQRWIPIPPEIRDLYLQAGRPRPLFRARRLEKRLGTPARLYYKSEFYSPTGSHKVNTALAQAWYAAQAGVERLPTGRGAGARAGFAPLTAGPGPGRGGPALSYPASLVGLKITVYWVRAVHDWKTDRL